MRASGPASAPRRRSVGEGGRDRPATCDLGALADRPCAQRTAPARGSGRSAKTEYTGSSSPQDSAFRHGAGGGGCDALARAPSLRGTASRPPRRPRRGCSCTASAPRSISESGSSSASNGASTKSAMLARVAAARTADAEPHPQEVARAERVGHRAQAVVALQAAAELGADAVEVDLDVVVDRDHLRRLELEEARGVRDRRARTGSCTSRARAARRAPRRAASRRSGRCTCCGSSRRRARRAASSTRKPRLCRVRCVLPARDCPGRRPARPASRRRSGAGVPRACSGGATRQPDSPPASSAGAAPSPSAGASPSARGLGLGGLLASMSSIVVGWRIVARTVSGSVAHSTPDGRGDVAELDRVAGAQAGDVDRDDVRHVAGQRRDLDLVHRLLQDAAVVDHAGRLALDVHGDGRRDLLRHGDREQVEVRQPVADQVELEVLEDRRRRRRLARDGHLQDRVASGLARQRLAQGRDVDLERIGLAAAAVQDPGNESLAAHGARGGGSAGLAGLDLERGLGHGGAKDRPRSRFLRRCRRLRSVARGSGYGSRKERRRGSRRAPPSRGETRATDTAEVRLAPRIRSREVGILCV